MDIKTINLEKELQELKYMEDSLYLTNVVPIDLAHQLGGDYNDIDIIGGRDLDYEGKFGKYYVNGSALYGTCSIYLINAPKKPKEIVKKEIEDIEYKKYKATLCEKNGRLIKNIPPIRDNVSDMELNELLEKGILKPFYLFPHTNSPYHIFYAKDEWDVRDRAIAIWGSFNDIKNEQNMQETLEFYKKYPKYMWPKISIENPVFVLDWEFEKEN